VAVAANPAGATSHNRSNVLQERHDLGRVVDSGHHGADLPIQDVEFVDEYDRLVDTRCARLAWCDMLDSLPRAGPDRKHLDRRLTGGCAPTTVVGTMRRVWVRGGAMTQFGKHVVHSTRDLVEEVVAGALREADLVPGDVQAVYASNAVAGLITGQECMRAQTVLRRTGLMGVPIVNVENADASGSTAFHLAWQSVAYGAHDCVVALGYEKLDHVEKARTFRAVNSGMDLNELSDIFGWEAGQERTELLELLGFSYGPDGHPLSGSETLAMVSVKNHYHGTLIPLAHYREPVTVEQVLRSRPVAGPLTRLMCAPLSDGAACAVLCSRNFKRGRRGGVRIAASVLRSGRGDDMCRPMTLDAAIAQSYEMAGVGPEDLDVAEVHDATSMAELFSCSHLGLCPLDEVDRLVADRTTWLGGAMPVNTSGGLLARGHPLGATGIAQIVEVAMQLEGRCGSRQVPAARVGLADNVGGWIGSDIGAGGTHILIA